MKAKITLQIDEEVIANSKEIAKSLNLPISKFAEQILRRFTTARYRSIEEMPVSDWVNIVSDGEVQYLREPRTSKQLKDEYYNRK